ncbi:MAG TPA: adenylate/guanylate cyclase domain-containing protein [Candidatus Limnocylindrales bacterium]
MGEYSRQAAAARAGVSLEDVSRQVELGILAPDDADRFSPGDVRRAGLVQSLVAAGIPLDGLAAAISRGEVSFDFVDNPIYERLVARGDMTFQELSAKTGVPVELLTLIREATGSAQPSPTDRMREDELAIAPVIELQFAEGFRPIAIERFLRVIGDSLRRVTETEGEWWYTEVIEPRVARGMSQGEAFSPYFAERMAGLLEQTLLAVYHAQQARSWTATIIRGVEDQLATAGLHSRLARPPAMCFFDITGYTRLTQERGDAAAAQLAGELARLVQRTSVQHGGRPVKWLGDGVMFYFREPGPGVMAALDMVDGAASAGLPPAHVGLHAGPVIFQEGDYFGQTVNVASRIAEYARPGEVVVSQDVVDASEGAGAIFTEIGPVELKGVSGAIRLQAAHRQA